MLTLGDINGEKMALWNWRHLVKGSNLAPEQDLRTWNKITDDEEDQEIWRAFKILLYWIGL